ncbi:MAG: Gfo/Idh/MocA family protein [Christensenellaceae bacterium]|jgi:myo-inositol 2-dehydrogenase/D-chiro-inositol 1-dehydrogenase
MSLRVGVLGTGAIGSDHARRISQVIRDAELAAVFDVYTEGAQKVADQFGAKRFDSAEELIASPDVDAIIVASIDKAHEKSVLDAIAAKKPVLCEKPLAETAAGCRRIVDAEIAAGKPLVQVGFMRRYDKGYRMLKEAIDSGEMGVPLMCHCTHRNYTLPDPNYTMEMHITNCAIHEIDVMHWLVDDTYKSAQVIIPRQTKYVKGNAVDPQVMILMTEKGIYIEVEILFNSNFAYDINCEVVCESGTASLPQPQSLDIRRDAKAYQNMETSWKNRFIEAYDIEMQDWVDSTLRGEVNGPTAWDGYIAAVTADACIKAQKSGLIEPISFGEMPAFYKR